MRKSQRQKERAKGGTCYLGIFNRCRPIELVEQQADHNREIAVRLAQQIEKSHDRWRIKNFFDDLDSKIQELCTCRDRSAFKKCFHKIIKFCMDERLGASLPVGENAGVLPVIWTNSGMRQGDDELALLAQDEFKDYLTNQRFPPLMIAKTCFQRILEDTIRDINDEDLNNEQPLVPFYREIAKQMKVIERRLQPQLKRMEDDVRPQQEVEEFRSKIQAQKEIPMWRVVSEVYAEHFDIKNIAEHLRIESGQHTQTVMAQSQKVPAEKIKISSDACLFTNELTTILARVAKYNLDSRRFNLRMRQLNGIQMGQGREEIIDLSHCIQFPQGMKVKMRQDRPAQHLSDGDLVLKGPHGAPSTYLKVSIQTLLKYVEKATRQQNRMLTISETLKAIRYKGSLIPPEPERIRVDTYLKKMNIIISQDMIDRASNEPIVLTSNMESHDLIEPEDLLRIRQREGHAR